MSNPRFIQIKTDAGIGYLRRQELDPEANTYSLKADRTGAPLICIGHEDPTGAYHGHTVIVRCSTVALREQAIEIVRKKLGFGRRQDRKVEATGARL